MPNYAGEYNVYTPSGQTISYMLGEDGTYSKHYKILDQLGNTHLVLKGTEIVGSYLYEPFGKQITLYESNSKDRMSFIGKEKDIESELGDFGVRKYDYEIGRFTSIDPLWEKYYSWTPYHYCSNNPVMGSDPSGMADFYDPKNGNLIKHEDDGTDKQYLQYTIPALKIAGFTFCPGGIINQEISMDSDLGVVARTVYAEMRGACDDAKQIVAESIDNRLDLPKGTYERANGTVKGIVNKFYDATKKGNDNYDEFSNPFDSANKDKKSLNAWQSSMSAAIKGLMLDSNLGQGVIFYNSANPTQWDGIFNKISKSVNGIKGMWKL